MLKGRNILLFTLFFTALIPQARAEAILTLNEAYQQVLQNNPHIQSYRAKIAAAEGHLVQQSLMPNPEAVFEIENFGGDSPRNGFDATEYTLGVEQQIEVAGKRSKREQIAKIEKQKISQEALFGMQAKLAETKAAYMRVAIAQERLNLANRRNEVSDKTHTNVKKRISAAKAADIQHTKADLEVSAAKIEQRKAEKELSLAKITLANLIGTSSLDKSIHADLTVLPPLPDRETVMRALENVPISTISQLAVMRETSALYLAHAHGVPDPKFALGVRRFNEDDSTAFLASISIPINIFDRNQGGVAQAKANLKAAEAHRKAIRLNLTKQALELWQTLLSDKEDVLSYQENLLPSAKKAYHQAEDGFDRGAFGFLDLLDAQRTLFETQENHLKALASFHENKAKLDMLTGEYTEIATNALAPYTDKKE